MLTLVSERPCFRMTAVIVIITINTIQKQLSIQGKWKGRVGGWRWGGVVRGKGCGEVGGGVSIPVTQR